MLCTIISIIIIVVIMLILNIITTVSGGSIPTIFAVHNNLNHSTVTKSTKFHASFCRYSNTSSKTDRVFILGAEGLALIETLPK